MLKKLLNRFLWEWKRFWGIKFIIVKTKNNLKNDEILIYRNRIYVKGENKNGRKNNKN